MISAKTPVARLKETAVRGVAVQGNPFSNALHVFILGKLLNFDASSETRT
jgi:hypothetical protein